MTKAALLDLDNCISDDKWRMHLCEFHHAQPNDRYWKYHAECYRDQFLNRHIVTNLVAEGYTILIATSRPERVRLNTQRWLAAHNVKGQKLYMRPDDNQEPSTILKARMLDWAREDGFDVQRAIDDRIDVLEMYADEGVRICQQVFIHHPEVAHP